MPRTTADHLPEPGDDSALVVQMEQTNPRRTIAPQPEPGEQPDPPKGTPPSDERHDDEIRRHDYVATRQVGVFADGQDIPKDHWRPARLRSLLASGAIRQKGETRHAEKD